VQFIELTDPFGGQNFLATFGATLDSNISPVYPFPSDTPPYTAPAHLLIATPGYVALGGGLPAPDYVLPSNNWFNQLGDSINFLSGTSVYTFGVGQLPLDGNNSLNRPYGDFTVGTVGANSPTNLAGQTGHIVIPEPAIASGVACVAIATLCRRRRPH